MPNLAPIPIVLDKRDPGRGHIVVGRDYPAQLLFLQEVIGGAEVLDVPKVTDEMVLSRMNQSGNFIFVVGQERHVAISSDIRASTRLWAAAPIKKDSAALSALVRYAMGILGMEEADKNLLRTVGSKVIQQCKEDGSPMGMIWAATWALTDPDSGDTTWKHPWEDPWAWTGKTPITARLHLLYRDLCAWVFSRDDDRRGAEQLGISPSRFQWLKGVSMNAQAVDAALVVLSAWRSHPDDGYTTALKVGAIFAQR